LVIDARRLQFASPLDLTASVALAHSHATSGDKVTLALPRNAAVTSYLQRMDFIDRLPAGSQAEGQLPIEIRKDHSHSLLEVTPLSRETATPVGAHLGMVMTASLGPRLAQQMFRGLGELIDNAVSHGGSELGAFVAAQTYTGKTTGTRRLEMAICDTGMGVLAHLRQNPDHKHITHSNLALEWALRRGVSGAEGRRGNGLPDLLDLTGRAGPARLILRSDDGLLRAGRSGGRTMTRRLATSSRVNGTWTWLRISFPP
jgi:hypothetical protein